MLEELFLSQRHTLVMTIARMVGCPHTAEDLAHEAYVRVSSAVSTRPILNLQTFLFQTARNLAIDHLRRERTRRRFMTNEVDSEAWMEVASTQPSPETQTMDGQRLAMFDAALSKLPQRARHILLLNKIHGMGYPEIAAQLGVSESTVYNDIRMALAHCLTAMMDKDAL
ncbi:RNA polymerase sigma factor [Nitrospira sp. KM1]|uniref:RNA polymerase sigma factor n=1 Tax=Nitrospira sp. KM1 TaxID=1936990 RepID=UPI001565FC48|nr:sigma-70 family RNA polymerase sigma factor [Nitrospira sp. KM1]